MAVVKSTWNVWNSQRLLSKIPKPPKIANDCCQKALEMFGMANNCCQKSRKRRKKPTAVIKNPENAEKSQQLLSKIQKTPEKAKKCWLFRSFWIKKPKNEAKIVKIRRTQKIWQKNSRISRDLLSKKLEIPEIANNCCQKALEMFGIASDCCQKCWKHRK